MTPARTLPARQPADTQDMNGRRTTPFRLIGALLLALPLGACPDPAPRAQPTDTATRRQRDSAIARMPLPGARAVDRALGVLEATDQRNAAFDSIR
jgi:hypothetical protein